MTLHLGQAFSINIISYKMCTQKETVFFLKLQLFRNMFHSRTYFLEGKSKKFYFKSNSLNWSLLKLLFHNTQRMRQFFLEIVVLHNVFQRRIHFLGEIQRRNLISKENSLNWSLLKLLFENTQRMRQLFLNNLPVKISFPWWNPRRNSISKVIPWTDLC